MTPKKSKQETASEDPTTTAGEVWVPEGKKPDRPPPEKPVAPPERELITHNLSGTRRQHLYCPECGQRKFIRRVESKSFESGSEGEGGTEKITTLEFPYEMRGMSENARAYTFQLKRGEVWRDRTLFCSTCKDADGEAIKAVTGDT